MDKTEIKKAITEQIINMPDNDILNDYGTESIVGWCEDGDAFINNGYSEEQTEEIMTELRKIAYKIDAMTFAVESIDAD